jgi:hypothetical protein
MPTEFKIPELGENISTGDVVRMLVKAGDTIAKDQPVLELETDKATIEVPSTSPGRSGREGQARRQGQRRPDRPAVDDEGVARERGAEEKGRRNRRRAAEGAAARGRRGAHRGEGACQGRPKPQPAGAAEEAGEPGGDRRAPAGRGRRGGGRGGAGARRRLGRSGAARSWTSAAARAARRRRRRRWRDRDRHRPPRPRCAGWRASWASTSAGSPAPGRTGASASRTCRPSCALAIGGRRRGRRRPGRAAAARLREVGGRSSASR